MLLFVGIVAFVVIFAGGFWAGWYVRFAYPKKVEYRVRVDMEMGEVEFDPPLPRGTVVEFNYKQRG